MQINVLCISILGDVLYSCLVRYQRIKRISINDENYVFSVIMVNVNVTLFPSASYHNLSFQLYSTRSNVCSYLTKLVLNYKYKTQRTQLSKLSCSSIECVNCLLSNKCHLSNISFELVSKFSLALNLHCAIMDSEKEDLDNKYILRDISPILISDETLTPNNLPRITQPSIGKYLVHVDDGNDYSNNNQAEIAPKILDNWAARSRAFWVDKPGRNDFLQIVCKKFSGQIHQYSPKNNVHKMLFPRPISCEFAHIDEKRLCNVVLIEEMYRKGSTLAEPAKITKDLIENPCEYSAPFWWESDGLKDSDKPENDEHGIQNQNGQITANRWRPIPDPIGQRNKTKCQRKQELSLVGQPFKHEACMFYNENYPAAKLTVFPVKFST